MAFKISMPHSQARVPSFLEGKDVVKKPMQVLRKDVHSYFNPNLSEMVRENLKHQMADKLQYQAAFKPMHSRNAQTADSQYGGGGDYGSQTGRRARLSTSNFNKSSNNSPINRVKHFGHKAGEQLKDEETIPFKDLRQALDNTHEIFSQWKKD